MLATLRELFHLRTLGPLGSLLVVCLVAGAARGQPAPPPATDDEAPAAAPSPAESEPSEPEPEPAVSEPVESEPDDSEPSTPGPETDSAADGPVTPDGEGEAESEEDIEAPVDPGAEDEAPIDGDDAPPEVDLADPMGPVEAALDGLAAQGLTVTKRRRSVGALQGEVLTATISGAESELLLYVLDQVAEDGYQFLLAPVAPQSFELITLRARAGQGRGVDLVNVDDVEIDGTFRTGEDSEGLRKFTALPPGGVVPIEITDELSAVGYEATISATGPGRIRILVRPGRALRRIRVRGYIPLSERNVRRVLSPAARPGSLARGSCVDPKTLRRDRPDSVCEEGDLACRQWAPPLFP